MRYSKKKDVRNRLSNIGVGIFGNLDNRKIVGFKVAGRSNLSSPKETGCLNLNG